MAHAVLFYRVVCLIFFRRGDETRLLWMARLFDSNLPFLLCLDYNWLSFFLKQFRILFLFSVLIVFLFSLLKFVVCPTSQKNTGMTSCAEREKENLFSAASSRYVLTYPTADIEAVWTLIDGRLNRFHSVTAHDHFPNGLSFTKMCCAHHPTKENSNRKISSILTGLFLFNFHNKMLVLGEIVFLINGTPFTIRLCWKTSRLIFSRK